MKPRSLQPEKQSEQSDSTDEGIQIDLSDEHCLNAESSKTVTQLPLSKATAERSWHLSKTEREIVATDEEMQTSFTSKFGEKTGRTEPGRGVRHETGIEKPV
jgi:hypothetical protein